jgi:phosphatidylserine/phosphatidylglycerophosphate/cardiolipin synthase-like enzyme
MIFGGAMDLITRAGAWCNGEVAYIAWEVEKKIDNCIGFMITRIHETGTDAGQRRILPTWIAFTDQNNPNWNEQDSSVWPIQSFEWRDLTLRKSRDTTNVRPIDFKVHYEIGPVAIAHDGQHPLPASPTAPPTDAHGLPSYEGPKHRLVQIGNLFKTNTIKVTHTYGSNVKATFTNGILSTQNLLRQLMSVNKGPSKQVMAAATSKDKKTRVQGAKQKEDHLLTVLRQEIQDEHSAIRSFLMGDVFKFVSELVDRAKTEGGQVYLALYELPDEQLIALLIDAMKAKLIHIILTTAGNFNPNPKGTPKEDRNPVIWDTENDDPRRRLHSAAATEKDRVIDRMFNSTARIGHNKFAVYVKGGKPVAVMTGSTNWTETGLCTQSNNCIIVDDDNIAADYFAYWNRLKDDKQPARKQLTVTANGGTGKKKKVAGAAPNSAKQGDKIRSENRKPPQVRGLSGGGTARAWFSPNTKQATIPKTNVIRPVDLKEVYDRMDAASSAIMFLVFLPGRSGVNNIIGEAANIAADKGSKAGGESIRLAAKLNSLADKGRFVMGAISDPTALPDYKAPAKGSPKNKGIKLPPPAIWWPGGDQSKVALICAAAVRIPFGNLRPELLTAGHAIIHDKIIVIDPLDKEKCTVITGSHNLGYKASYCNDENLLIIEGNRDLSISYAVHVIDLYNHYLMRARLEEKIRQDIMDGKLKSYDDAAAQAVPHGLLTLGDDWQNKHFGTKSPSSTGYFLANVSPP